MYAAAGGASLASRQARQRQRQQKKNQQLQAKLHPPKPAGVGVGLGAADGGASTPTRSQSRQFHQLPTNYLRAPQPQGRKLSATYTQSRSLLPIEEAGDTQSVLQLRMHSHTHGHGHAHGLHGHGHSHLHHGLGPPVQTPYQQFASSHGRVSPKLVHRHSGSSAGFHPAAAAAAAGASGGGQLHKSATATLPLVSQMEATPPTTPALPSAAVGVKTTAASLETDATPMSAAAPIALGMAMASTSAAAAAAAAAEAEAHLQLAGAEAMFVPHHDAIIVTPATPMASPGHAAAVKLRRADDNEEPHDSAERQPLTATDAYDEDEAMQPPIGPLERKCSVYRMRRSDAFEQSDAGVTGGLKRQLRELQFQQPQYVPLVSDEPQLLFKGLGNGRKFQICAYCEEGICVCEHIECAQGRAAWLERGRRCSVQEQQQQQATCHRRWVKRNRIQDASLGGSSDDEDFLGVLRGPSTFANAFLYVGLGTVALGLVIAFVGTGEKGFKTVELRLIGPSLIGLGLICCILRILFCICPSHCISSSKKAGKKNANKIDADHTTSLLRNESKRVSIARGPSIQPKYPIAHKRSQSKMLNEGMEALRQIATTSLFMQNEQKTAINRVVPIINEPENMDHMGADAPLEMKKLQTALNMCEMSDEEQDDSVQIEQQQLQHVKRTRATTTTAVTSCTTKATGKSTSKTTTTKTTTTTLSTVNERPNSKLVRQRVALQQQRQQHQQQQQQQQPEQQQQPQPQLEQSQSLSSSSTVKDSLDGALIVEETSLMDTAVVPPTTPAMAMATALPSSCSTGAIPRLKSNNAAFSTPSPRPGVSTGATPKTTPTTTSSSYRTRLTSSQSQPTSYDLPPALPHTYSATATVRGPLGMTLTGSSPVYAMPAGRMSATVVPPTTTTISLLPLPAPPTATTTSTARASIPGQVLESSAMAITSLSILQPLPATQPATASAITAPSAALTSIFGSKEHKSQLSSPCLTKSRGSSLLAPPPQTSKLEPELVLSPAKLGQ
ncbi:uncharacterized protein [Drosophila virilis]|uniref:Uncharacterized protein, isoform C n=1 Tax=Drosophila virilis TaxID=7244 RepID=B4M8H3_DROVI|nr:uncharacterized protein LOC6634140 isoform X1 [Drosophila virilis]EDW57499.2 uncharacterized protein Dvir_GJ18107, isoform C [Drosophila virilis]